MCFSQVNGCDLDSAWLKMRAGRAAGTEMSAVRLSTCAGTCRPQSRFSHASILGHFRAPKSWLLLRWKKVTFPLENSGYIMKSSEADTVSHDASNLRHFRAPNSWRILRWKNMTFPLKNSGYIITVRDVRAFLLTRPALLNSKRK